MNAPSHAGAASLGRPAAYAAGLVIGGILAFLQVKALMHGTGGAAPFGAPQVVGGRFPSGSSVKGTAAFVMGAIATRRMTAARRLASRV